MYYRDIGCMNIYVNKRLFWVSYHTVVMKYVHMYEAKNLKEQYSLYLCIYVHRLLMKDDEND